MTISRTLGRHSLRWSGFIITAERKIIDAVEIEGVEHFRDALLKGKGILFITGHCGNWELMAIAVALKLHAASIVARPVDNPFINRFVERVRKKYGNAVIYKRGALKPILQTLKNNGVVGILMDQAVKRDEGFVMDFLGIGAWTMKMPALIARKTGAAVLPTFIHRTEKGHTITINPAVELSAQQDRDAAVVEDTKRFSWYIEEYIRQHPTEWLWIHKRWKTDYKVLDVHKFSPGLVCVFQGRGMFENISFGVNAEVPQCLMLRDAYCSEEGLCGRSRAFDADLFLHPADQQ